MKTSAKLLTLLVLAAAPAALFASSTDRQIDEAAKSSYNFRTVLDNEVTADTKDGVVTLTGTVNDRDQRTLAEDTVNNLPGVVSVNNLIKVESEPAEHSDGWIALKVRGQLLFHSNVSATATKVDVNSGVVTLTGTVDNLAQKDLTEAYVKDISGVKSVNNELIVNDNSRDMRDHSVADSIDDASITTEVKSALLFHRSTSALKTKVSTTNGVVMIGGEAGSDAEKDLVSKLAGSIRGVKSVDNDMTVRAN
jgi:hyperosmotically inducible periplasmic protein